MLDDIAQVQRRFGLAELASVVSGDAAGRDGFWLHRVLQAHGVPKPVVDASAIEVNHRQRRAKSDGSHVRKFLSMLRRYEQGEMLSRLPCARPAEAGW